MVGDVFAINTLLSAGLSRVFAVLVVMLVLALDVLCRLLDLHLLSSDALIREPLLTSSAFGTQTNQAVNRPSEKSNPTEHQQDPLHLSPVTHL